MIEVRDLEKSFGGKPVLRGVSMEIPEAWFWIRRQEERLRLPFHRAMIACP